MQAAERPGRDSSLVVTAEDGLDSRAFTSERGTKAGVSCEYAETWRQVAA
jgi:hypothetical protein